MPKGWSRTSLVASDVQTACAAAITAAGLATSDEIDALPAAVDALIDDEGIASDVDTLLSRFPDLLFAEETSVPAAGSSEIVAASPGQQVAVYGWNVNAETAFAAGGGAVAFFTGDIMTGSPVRSGAIPAGGQWIQELGDEAVFSTATGDPLTFANDGTDAVTVRIAYKLVAP